MKKTRRSETQREAADPRREPDLNRLREEFQWSVQHRDANVWTRARLNYNARYCRWRGQTSDGRKWAKHYQAEVFPWDGASDARVHLVDTYAREDVALLMVLWERMRTVVTGVEANDAQLSQRLTQLLRWQKYTAMKEARREAELLANYLVENGQAALGVFWARETQLGYEEIDLEDIQTAAMEAQARLQRGQATERDALIARLPQMILDPALEDEAVTLAKEQFAQLGEGRVRQILRDLRKDGQARFPQPYVKKDRPQLWAGRCNDDLFLPPEEMPDNETLSAIDRRELLTETTLRSRIHSHGWDKAWVEEVIATQRGRITNVDGVPLLAQTQRRNSLTALALGQSRLFEIVHAYRRRHDPDGVPGLYYTCYTPGITDTAGYHDLLNYEHGQHPFVFFQLEWRSRLPDDSRGYGEVGFTWQNTLKRDLDARIDRADLATLPPSHYPLGRAPDQWGPGCQIPTDRPDDYGFLAAPKYDVGSKEVAEDVRALADRWFGRPVDERNAADATNLRQQLGNKWMTGWAEVDTMLLQLDQQFMPESFFYRVVGSQKAKTIRASREEIQGEFDVAISFNVQRLDPEYVKIMGDVIRGAVELDVNGILDHDAILEALFELTDANLGERVMKPGEEATQQEIRDTRRMMAQMTLGMGEDVLPGQAYQLRLQTIQNELQTNPRLRQIFEKDPVFRELLETYAGQLQQQVEQRENAVRGRLGGHSMRAGAPQLPSQAGS